MSEPSNARDVARLNKAFETFMAASKSLEGSYAMLQERVRYLTNELERKNAELQDALNETQEAKDYLGGILGSLNEAIVVMEPSGTVAMINRAAEELFCLAAEEAAGRNFYSLDLTLEGEGADAFLYAGGRKRNVMVSRSEVRDAGGAVRGRVMLLQDVTRLKELEAQQERNHRLISMGEMATKIVHEVRSPLCSIELYASMLARDLAGTDHENLAEGISTSIKSLNNVLTNMLFFARPQKPSLRGAGLGPLLRESLFILAPMVESRGIALERTGEESLEVTCDPELLKQAMLNIIINAVQVTPQGGRLGVGLRAEEGFAVLEVSDEGGGIERENIERIFDPFFSTRERGTGLGLAIAAKIMQAHGGTIKVESEPGVGSRFSIHVPMQGDAVKRCSI